MILIPCIYVLGKFGGKSLANFTCSMQFIKLKPSKLIFIINKILADLLIHQNVLPNTWKDLNHKTSRHQTFQLYGIIMLEPDILNAVLVLQLAAVCYKNSWPV